MKREKFLETIGGKYASDWALLDDLFVIKELPPVELSLLERHISPDYRGNVEECRLYAVGTLGTLSVYLDRRREGDVYVHVASGAEAYVDWLREMKAGE